MDAFAWAFDSFERFEQTGNPSVRATNSRCMPQWDELQSTTSTDREILSPRSTTRIDQMALIQRSYFLISYYKSTDRNVRRVDLGVSFDGPSCTCLGILVFDYIFNLRWKHCKRGGSKSVHNQTGATENFYAVHITLSRSRETLGYVFRVFFVTLPH
jgi:hypothetical protein